MLKTTARGHRHAHRTLLSLAKCTLTHLCLTEQALQVLICNCNSELQFLSVNKHASAVHLYRAHALQFEAGLTHLGITKCVVEPDSIHSLCNEKCWTCQVK